MTSDAKIGLLLGLIFIFVIAFVINGLPSFRNATNSSELTTNMVSSQHENWGIGTNERKVQQDLDLADELIEPVGVDIPSPPAEEKTENVRFEMPIPENSAIVEETSIQITPELIERTLAQSSSPVVHESAATEPIVAESVETIVIELPTAEERPEPSKPKPSSARGVVPKVYVVSDGDTLGSIAKKFYGPEEGNKIATVLRIFEANRKSLESMHKVVVGQKIIVPPPKTPKPDESKTESIRANSLFEDVKSIGRRLFSGDKPKRKAKPGGQYIVQDGDNLWRVAAVQLGDSMRYKEIVKLNPDALKDENAILQIGMHLNLPGQ